MLISLELNSNYYKAVSFLVAQIPTRGDNAENKSDIKNHNNELTIISSPEYLWIPQSIFNKSFDTHSYYSSKGIKADRFIMMIDDRFLSILVTPARHGVRFSTPPSTLLIVLKSLMRTLSM